MSPWRAAWLAIFFGVLIWSGINPKDTVTWVLEVLPAIIALVLLVATRDRFPLTTLAYTLVLVHCVILMIGGALYVCRGAAWRLVSRRYRRQPQQL